MIADKDRSGYIGGSDTSMVMRSWNTKTFEKWWRTKQGFGENNISTDAMKAGTAYEHKILDSLGIPEMEKDKQIIIGRIRVNLDGNTPDMIYEVKTHSADKEFKVSADYRRQVNVEMWASGIHRAVIVSYALEPEDYKNYFRDIDPDRVKTHVIEYDEEFLRKYKARVAVLCECLANGTFPLESML